MAILTFAQLEAEAAAWHAAEAASREPAAVALRAPETLREALAVMGLRERCEVLGELHALSVELAAEDWATFGAAVDAQQG